MTNTPPIQYARSADGTSIGFVMKGALGGVPALVIPALGTTMWAGWDEHSQPIMTGFRHIDFDRRGTGCSSRTAPIALDLLVQDCLAVADCAGYESFHLLATYAASFEAIELVLRHPDRVRSLCLGDPFPPGFADLPPVPGWRASLDADWEWFAETWVRSWGEPEPGQPVVPGLVQHFKSTHDPVSFRAILKLFVEIKDAMPLDQLRVPTVVFHRESMPRMAKFAEYYASRIPGAKLVASRGSHGWNISPETRAALTEFVVSTMPPEEVPLDWLPSGALGAKQLDIDSALSHREQEVLRLVALGCSNREVAAELTLSLPTVATHLRHILDKLGVENRAAAAAWAVRKGLA